MNLDGGIHEIPLSSVAGRLWLCGKHKIAPDVEALVAHVSADHVVCLVQEHELSERYPAYVTWLNTAGRCTWQRIPDLSSPPLHKVLPLYESVVERLHRGENVIAHCAAGDGRAGTLAVAVCLLTGMDLEQAMSHVRQSRPGAGPEVGSQLDAMIELSTLLRR